MSSFLYIGKSLFFCLGSSSSELPAEKFCCRLFGVAVAREDAAVTTAAVVFGAGAVIRLLGIRLLLLLQIQ